MASSGEGAASHRFLEHTGEVRLLVRAPTFEALFREAGRALAELLDQARSTGPLGPSRTVSLQADDRAALLVDWLNELIFVAEAESMVPREIEILALDGRSLTARVRGVSCLEPPSLVKAATLHGARVAPVEGGFEGEIVLDV